MALKQAKIYTITSVKGGSGKTLTTINLAGCFSLKNKKVLIIDLDFYTGDISLLLKLQAKKNFFDIIEDLNNNTFDKIDDYITKYNDNIDVIASVKDPRAASKIGNKYLSVILAKVKYKYDVILFDTTHILDEINLIALDSSDYILYVIKNDLMNLKNMRTMVSIYTDMEKNNYKIILNEACGKKGDFTKYDVKNMIGDNIDYTIPESFYIKNIEKYLYNGIIPTLDKKIQKKHKKAIENFNKLINKIYEEENEEKSKKVK